MDRKLMEKLRAEFVDGAADATQGSFGVRRPRPDVDNYEARLVAYLEGARYIVQFARTEASRLSGVFHGGSGEFPLWPDAAKADLAELVGGLTDPSHGFRLYKFVSNALEVVPESDKKLVEAVRRLYKATFDTTAYWWPVPDERGKLTLMPTNAPSFKAVMERWGASVVKAKEKSIGQRAKEVDAAIRVIPAFLPFYMGTGVVDAKVVKTYWFHGFSRQRFQCPWGNWDHYEGTPVAMYTVDATPGVDET